MEDHAQGERDREPAELRENGVRSRLRGLFAPTDAAEAVADLIEVHGRELEVRSAKLLTAVHDLELREERVLELHTRVLEILREGSAELDARQAELNTSAAELDERESALALAEGHVSERARELGAVELRRAAVERREEAVRERSIQLERQAAELAQLASRLDAVGTASVDLPPTEPETAHVALTISDTYRLLERDGPPPAPGDEVELDDGPYRCVRVTVSPYPTDARRCAVLARVPEALSD